MDSTLHLWTVQPFAPTVNAANPALHPRLVRSFYGAPAGFEQLLRKASFSRHVTPEGQTGTMVAAGGADRALTVWDATTGEIRYKVRGLSLSLSLSPRRPRPPCGVVPCTSLPRRSARVLTLAPPRPCAASRTHGHGRRDRLFAKRTDPCVGRSRGRHLPGRGGRSMSWEWACVATAELYSILRARSTRSAGRASLFVLRASRSFSDSRLESTRAVSERAESVPTLSKAREAEAAASARVRPLDLTGAAAEPEGCSSLVRTPRQLAAQRTAESTCTFSSARPVSYLARSLARAVPRRSPPSATRIDFSRGRQRSDKPVPPQFRSPEDSAMAPSLSPFGNAVVGAVGGVVSGAVVCVVLARPRSTQCPGPSS